MLLRGFCARVPRGVVQRRSFCERLATETTLKRHLSRLWLKVHPDLFSQNPAEQAVNEASFKALQQALSEVEAGSNKPQRAPVTPPENLEFYYHTADKTLQQTSVALHKGRLDAALVDLFRALSLI